MLQLQITLKILYLRFSRRIMWLHVGPSNNDPFIIAGYYLDCVKTLGAITVVDFGKLHTIIVYL